MAGLFVLHSHKPQHLPVQGERKEEMEQNKELIYERIVQVMKEIGAIGKDSENKTQNSRYRSIDAVMNALQPALIRNRVVMIPEVLSVQRTDRMTSKGGVMTFSNVRMRYRFVAVEDGSRIEVVMEGEGMDSGDKASNKAMSVALKYACFQLFMIPTEEMVDPDQESHDVTSGAKTPDKPKETRQENITAGRHDAPATVGKVDGVPAPEAAQNPPENTPPVNPVLAYLSKERENLLMARKITAQENTAIWNKQIAVLREHNKIPQKALSTYTKKEAEELVNFMYTLFTEKGTELMNVDGQTA